MNKISLTLFLFFSAQWISAQNLSIEVPTEIKAHIGQELSIKLGVNGIKKYTLSMEGNPGTSFLQNDHFVWTPKHPEARKYLVKFFLKDSLGVIKNESEMALEVEGIVYPPRLAFDKELPDTIRVEENQPFSFSATLKSGNGSDPKALMIYFLFNENPDLRSFDSCRVNRMGDQLLFEWTPSSQEAERGYAKFRITLVDKDNSVGSQVLNFKIKDVNLAPIFRNEIPDTVFIPASGDLMLDFAATDPDHSNNLKYEYSPKSANYFLQGSKIIFKPNFQGNDQNEYPIHLSVSVTDGEHTIRRNVCILKSKQYRQLTIGDFTRKQFFEGDSLVTFLNISNDADLKQYAIKFNDLGLPQGIGSLTHHLVFEKGSSYIKVYSKGPLPYYLVDQDYTYNIAVTLYHKDGKTNPVFKVLELTVNDRPDPTSMGHQKDSLLFLINNFLRIETTYKTNLEKMYSSINKPWWKKVAIVTGTLSGVLGLLQSQNPQKSISIISAGISLVSITVSNLPSLTEKTVNELNDKMASSKGRIDQMQEKESDFMSTWSSDIDRSAFYKMKADILERINKGQAKRKEEVCALLKNKTLNRKITNLTKGKNDQSNTSQMDIVNIFRCLEKP